MAETSETNQAGSSSRPLGDDEEIIQLDDIIKHQDDMMEEVAAVLGAGDDFNCSYNQGYMKRQALYACLTCVPQGKDDYKKAAGFCLACSYHCHDGHNLIELYTKRRFRCDCGNLKFGNAQCNLDANKDDFNYDNAYNQNFSGLYCICAKPYPDPEDTVEDDMIQCIICEDWYHSRHLKSSVAEDFAEMICANCVKSNDFLMSYMGYAPTKIDNTKAAGEIEENVNVTSPEAPKEEETTKAEPSEGTEEPSATDEASTKKCTRPVVKKEEAIPKALFMKELSWRQQLCKCVDCMTLYKERDVEYLLDPEDTVEFYENKGKEKYNDAKKKAMEAEAQILKSMPRAPLLDAMAGFNDFKEQLADYLKQFAEQQKVLTVEDVKEFFSKLKSNKRQKTSDTSFYCR